MDIIDEKLQLHLIKITFSVPANENIWIKKNANYEKKIPMKWADDFKRHDGSI